MTSSIRRNSTAGVILPASSKEIEFVVPPTISPYSSSRQLNSSYRQQPPLLTPNYVPSPAQPPPGLRKNSKSEEAGLVNKGWSLLQDVFAQPNSELRKNSRSASLSVSSLGINRVGQNSLGVAKLPQERRASTNSIFLNPSPGQSGRRSRSHSKGSIFAYTPPGQCSPGVTSAPGSRKNSKPSIFIQPAPEILGNAQLGGLDPSLYLDPDRIEEKEESFPENHLGRLYFSIHYDSINEALCVLVKRIKNLPKHTKESGITNKTYVKICLLPDERSQQRCSPSGDSFADLNPVFNENFVFPVSPLTMQNRSLRLLVFNIDVNRKHRVVGQTILEMQGLDLSQGKLNLSADLEKYVKISESERPEILLSICYNASLSRLTVNVVECKNLKVDSGNAPDTYIKVQLLYQTKVLKTKKTSIIKKDDSPQYKESFNLRLEEKEVEQAGLRVTCMQNQPILEKDRPLGHVVLGGFMFARGPGQEHWEEVIKIQKNHIQKWHKLVEVQAKGKKLKKQDSI